MGTERRHRSTLEGLSIGRESGKRWVKRKRACGCLQPLNLATAQILVTLGMYLLGLSSSLFQHKWKKLKADRIPQKLWLRGPAMGWEASPSHDSHLLYSSCPWFPTKRTSQESPLSHGVKPVAEVLGNQMVKISEAHSLQHKEWILKGWGKLIWLYPKFQITCKLPASQKESKLQTCTHLSWMKTTQELLVPSAKIILRENMPLCYQ